MAETWYLGSEDIPAASDFLGKSWSKPKEKIERPIKLSSENCGVCETTETLHFVPVRFLINQMVQKYTKRLSSKCHYMTLNN